MSDKATKGRKKLYPTLPRTRFSDDVLRAHGYRYLWFFWSNKVESISWRGKVIQFVDEKFETDDLPTAEMLAKRDDVDIDGFTIVDADGRDIMRTRYH